MPTCTAARAEPRVALQQQLCSDADLHRRGRRSGRRILAAGAWWLGHRRLDSPGWHGTRASVSARLQYPPPVRTSIYRYDCRPSQPWREAPRSIRMRLARRVAVPRPSRAGRTAPSARNRQHGLAEAIPPTSLRGWRAESAFSSIFWTGSNLWSLVVAPPPLHIEQTTSAAPAVALPALPKPPWGSGGRSRAQNCYIAIKLTRRRRKTE